MKRWNVSLEIFWDTNKWICKYRRTNRNLHVRGYKEEGTITTAFDMTVLNDLVIDVIDRLMLTSEEAQALKQLMEMKLIEHRNYINIHGVDMPEIRNWKWE